MLIWYIPDISSFFGQFGNKVEIGTKKTKQIKKQGNYELQEKQKMLYKTRNVIIV